MKRKVGTILEEEVIRRAKRQAAEEDRPFSDLIQEALENYLSSRIPEPARREAAYQLFCGSPIRLSADQFQAVLEEDAWNL